MKDLIKRIIVIVIFWAFLAYLGYLIFQGKSITTAEYANLNNIVYIILIALCVYIFFIYGIYPVHIRFSRATLLVIAIALVILSQTILANDGPNGIYIGDLFSVLGVCTLILFPTNLIITDKVKSQKKKKNEVIIEV